MSSCKQSFARSSHAYAWLVVILLTGVLIVMVLSVYSVSKHLSELKDENARLQLLLHNSRRRTNGLDKTAMPLFERAVRSFPNTSPRKSSGHPEARQRDDRPPASDVVLPA